MPRGGARPGAGRKTNAEIAEVRDLIDSVASTEEWKQLFANLFEIAKTDKGHAAVQAATLLCRYRFGVPAQQEPVEADPLLGPIEFIEVDPYPALRDDEPDAGSDCETNAEPGDETGDSSDLQTGARSGPQPRHSRPPARPTAPAVSPAPAPRGAPAPAKARLGRNVIRRLRQL